MKRVAVLSLVCACTAAGFLSAFAFAGGGPAATTTTRATATATTTATTASTPTTTTAPTTTTSPRPPPPPPPPPPQTLAEGVRVGGVPVGGLTPPQARAAIVNWFATPLPVRYANLVFAANSTKLAAPNVIRAVERAKAAPPFARVPLVVVTRRSKIRAYVAALARRIDRAPVDSVLFLRNRRPFATKEKPGRRLLRTAAERAIARSLTQNARARVELRAAAVAPRVTRRSFGPVVVIQRGANRLNLYRGTRAWRVFGIATGTRAYPTPLGRFQIVVMWKNPWWYPPNSPWAKGEKPIPPGPGNPLGTRWMGISSPGVGIHGTPDAASIGYSASHGCIRMRIPDAEWLFDHVSIGTPVFIVG